MLKKVLLLLIIVLLVFLKLFMLRSKNINYSLQDYKIQEIKINKSTFIVYISDTDSKRIKGLSNVDKLKSNEGMIFVWEDKDNRYFWMKDMKFDLDFVFINGNKIVDTFKNISASSYPKTFTSKKKVDKVIEFNSGTIEKNKIKTQDIIDFN